MLGLKSLHQDLQTFSAIDNANLVREFFATRFTFHFVRGVAEPDAVTRVLLKGDAVVPPELAFKLR